MFSHLQNGCIHDTSPLCCIMAMQVLWEGVSSIVLTVASGYPSTIPFVQRSKQECWERDGLWEKLQWWILFILIPEIGALHMRVTRTISWTNCKYSIKSKQLGEPLVVLERSMQELHRAAGQNGWIQLPPSQFRVYCGRTDRGHSALRCNITNSPSI